MPSQQPDGQPPEEQKPENPGAPDFGDPGDLGRLLAMAKLDQRDLDQGIRWFNENASDGWKGALDKK